MMSHSIEGELIAAVKFRPKKGLSRQDTLTALVEAGSALADDDWDKLSTLTQKWVNRGVSALEAKRPVKPPVDPAAGKEKKVKEPVKAKKPAKPAKVEAKRPEPGEGRGAGMSNAQTMIKQLILEDFNITTEEIVDRLSKAGHNPTRFAIATIKSSFKHSLKVVHAAGRLKGGLT
jgi:hypothetical protein